MKQVTVTFLTDADTDADKLVESLRNLAPARVLVELPKYGTVRDITLVAEETLATPEVATA